MVDSDPEIEVNGDPIHDFIEFLNSPFITAVLSTFIVSVIAFFAGKFRSISKRLESIPKLENDNTDIKKKVVEIEGKLDKNTNDLKVQLEKIEERMDKRFDSINDVQRSIEHSMNEKFVNLLISLRNYSTGEQGTMNLGSSSSKRYQGD